MLRALVTVRAAGGAALALLALLALVVACTASPQAAKRPDALRGLEDCPQPHEVALRGADIEHMNALLADAEQRARADRSRCAPAKRECVASCAAYTARCPKPYVAMNGRIPSEQASPSEFCDDACDGAAPYLTLARFFDGTACSLSASVGPSDRVDISF